MLTDTPEYLAFIKQTTRPKNNGDLYFEKIQNDWYNNHNQTVVYNAYCAIKAGRVERPYSNLFWEEWCCDKLRIWF